MTLAAATEDVGLRADALIALGEVLGRADANEEARATLDEALGLLNAKGDRATARRIGASLEKV